MIVRLCQGHVFTLMVGITFTSNLFSMKAFVHVGIPRNISFPFCTCESDCIKLIRLHYWPATSSKPLIAFTFQFLDWLEALLLEYQVAVQDMTQAISYLIKDKLGQVRHSVYVHVGMHANTI